MSLKHNTKQRNKTIQGLRSFKDTLPTKVKRILKKKGQIFSKMLDNWRYIVGDDLFKVCYPKSFKNSSRFGDSYLNIMVKRGHEIDLEYSKMKIKEKINYFFGYNVVEKIKLNTFEENQYNNDEKPLKPSIGENKYLKKISTIQNVKIKNSLKKLSILYKKK